VFGQIGDQFRRVVSYYAEANFYTKVHDRVLAPPQLCTALRAIEQHIDQRLAQSRLPAAA
jgi:hypothetical protein